MTLRLYYHPFSSYCQKVLIALYENPIPFEAKIVDLGDAQSRAAFAAVWPLAKFPVLREEASGLTIPESTTVIEYMAQHHTGPTATIPADPDAALQARIWDRFQDNYVQTPIQKTDEDRRRPGDQREPHGLEWKRKRRKTH